MRTSFVTIERAQTMTAEMAPDMYGGDECDTPIPQWFAYAEGDKEGSTDSAPLTLDPRRFPPGTQILVMEPICPKCEEVRGIEDVKCSCGYDWRKWDVEHYG